MQEKAKRFFTDIWMKFSELEKPRKVKLVSACLIMIAAISIASYLLLRPQWVVIADNATWNTISQMQMVLDSAGVPHRTINNATGLMVRQQDTDRANLSIGISEINLDGVFTYADALEASGIGTTESVIQRNFQRAREHELAQSLRLIDGVENAVVNLNIPRRSPIPLPSDERATASVALTLSRTLDRQQAAGIARYIAMSVPGLESDNVTIIDTAGGNVLYYQGETVAGQMIQGEFELERIRRAEMETQIRLMLSPLFDEVRVLSNLVLNLDTIVHTEVVHTSPMGPDSATGLIDWENTDRQQVENRPVDAEPGMAPNANINYLMGGDMAGSASVRREERRFLHNIQEQIRQTPSGGVLLGASSASVVVFRNNYIYQQELINDGTIGGENGMTWEAYQRSMMPMPFDAEDAVIVAAADILLAGTGLGAIEVVGFEVPVFVPYVQPPGINIMTVVALGILALLILLLALGILRRAQQDEVTEIEPELSVEDLLVSTQLEEQREAEIEATLGGISVEDSELKKLLDKFVDENPEAVAALLKNWLSDDWR
ncbi:MAG: hypothetical protein FWE20_01855 [Defluviitaleaceae bacterium]|nr:hypothetical protein [Defluviitaleaceae bacterium]